MEKKSNKVINTPYDDVFRTLLNDCSELIIPVINEIFGTHYTGDEEIIFAPNEHFLNQQDGEEEKRITDSSFVIVGDEKKRFLCECQSIADSSMLVRIFEYATQIALDQGETVQNTLRVEIPHSALLFLRSRASTPDKMEIEMKTPGGTVRFDVLVMKSQRYTIDDIFDRKLLFLIPFYIFSHESRFEEYDKNEDKLEILKAEYIRIVDRLDEWMRKGSISAYMRKTILEMSGKVLENIAQKYDNVREGVKSVMGGRVLEYEAKTILNEGMKQGIKQGIKQGVQQGLQEGEIKKAKETAWNLRALGMDDNTIADAVNVQVALVKKWFAEDMA